MRPYHRHSLAIALALFIATLAAGQDLRAEDAALARARAEVGVREQGNNDGPRVRLYLQSVGLGPGYAWCGAFVAYCYDSLAWGNAWAPSWFNKRHETHSPEPGAVFGIHNQRLKRIAHVGIVETVQGQTIITIEGNTNDAGAREGDGVYRRRRPIRTIRKFARR